MGNGSYAVILHLPGASTVICNVWMWLSEAVGTSTITIITRIKNDIERNVAKYLFVSMICHQESAFKVRLKHCWCTEKV